MGRSTPIPWKQSTLLEVLVALVVLGVWVLATVEREARAVMVLRPSPVQRHGVALAVLADRR